MSPAPRVASDPAARRGVNRNVTRDSVRNEVPAPRPQQQQPPLNPRNRLNAGGQRSSHRRSHPRRTLSESRQRESWRNRRIMDETYRNNFRIIPVRPPNSTRNGNMREGNERRSGSRNLMTSPTARFGQNEDWLYEIADIADPKDLECLYTGRVVRRLCLVLDCVTPHEFSNDNDHLINLQHYVIAKQTLPELEALTILYHTAVVVNSLHQVRFLVIVSLEA